MSWFGKIFPAVFFPGVEQIPETATAFSIFLINRGGKRRAFRLPGEGRDHCHLSAPKSQRFLRFLRLRCPWRTRNCFRFPRQDAAMLHCDLRLRWKVTSDSRFQAAISEPETLPFCRTSGGLAPSTRKSLAIAILRFWFAKISIVRWNLRPVIFWCRQMAASSMMSTIPRSEIAATHLHESRSLAKVWAKLCVCVCFARCWSSPEIAYKHKEMTPKIAP